MNKRPETNADFENLAPHQVLDAVELALNTRLTGMLSPLPSYINRVYEVQANDDTRYIAKFYRPGRWARGALEDEQRFTLDCAEEEVPVVPPIPLADGTALGEYEGIFFAVFPKRAGRETDLCNDESWIRLGSIAGRMHLAGSRAAAEHRLTLHPCESLAQDSATLENIMPPRHAQRLQDFADELTERTAPLFDDTDCIRIHGDCHRGNILERPGEGLLIIDFDDMMNGPPVQDLWLLLPDHAHHARRELDLMIEGYEQFMEFDDFSLQLIEPLRAMRLIYFLAWCARQRNDRRFRHHFPDWGSDPFWEQEMRDLEHQMQIIREHAKWH